MEADEDNLREETQNISTLQRIVSLLVAPVSQRFHILPLQVRSETGRAWASCVKRSFPNTACEHAVSQGVLVLILILILILISRSALRRWPRGRLNHG